MEEILIFLEEVIFTFSKIWSWLNTPMKDILSKEISFLSPIWSWLVNGTNFGNFTMLNLLTSGFLIVVCLLVIIRIIKLANPVD